MAGQLVYVMGPSGSGKDTLLGSVARRLGNRAFLAHRVVTRPSTATEPGSVSVTHEQFAEQARAGRFALMWRANGLCYGVPSHINQHLAAGCFVLVNGSRAYLPQALKKYPDMLGVLVSTSPDVLRARLLGRGRESEEQIQARLDRNRELDCVWTGKPDAMVRIDNSAELETACQALYQWLDARVAVSAGSLRCA